MCVFRSPAPKPQPLPPLPAPIPTPQKQDPAVTTARQKSRQQAALAQGRDSTILTGGLGLIGGARSSAKKRLLGS